MSLKKGFLRPAISLEALNLDKKKLTIGTFYWLILSFSIYSISIVIKEALRGYSFWLNEEDFLVLLPVENYFYNVFFAYLACIFSFTTISNHWIMRSSTLRNISRYNKAIIFHDKVSFSWYFIFWFTQMGILFYVCTELGSFLEFNLFPDYLIIFLLMPFVLYLHQWLKLRLVFKNSIIPWMIGVFLSISIVAMLFGMIDILPYKRINDLFLKRTIGYHIKVELPLLKNGNLIGRKSLVSEIYLGYPKNYADTTPLIMTKDYTVKEISFNDISNFVKEESIKVDEYDRFNLKWNLRIDKSMKMEYVKRLKDELWKNGVRRVYLATTDISKSLYRSSTSLHQLVRNPEEDYLRILHEADDEVILFLNIKSDVILIDHQKTDSVEFHRSIKAFFKENGKNGVILFKVDNESTFERYATIFDQVISIVKELRDEWLVENFNVHYTEDEVYDATQLKRNKLAAQYYPVNILEIN